MASPPPDGYQYALTSQQASNIAYMGAMHATRSSMPDARHKVQ
jgi:hypothetical protein